LEDLPDGAGAGFGISVIAAVEDFEEGLDVRVLGGPVDCVLSGPESEALYQLGAGEVFEGGLDLRGGAMERGRDGVGGLRAAGVGVEVEERLQLGQAVDHGSEEEVEFGFHGAVGGSLVVR
jgi:hypothetical protein